MSNWTNILVVVHVVVALAIIGLVLLSGVLLHRHGTRPCGP